jgi:hypothetical protein
MQRDPPLSDERTRETVLAAAYGLAGRFGIEIVGIGSVARVAVGHARGR